MFESESVSVFADAFTFSVAHVSADDGHNTHLGTCEFAFGGDVVGPSEFFGVFWCDGECEARFGVCDGDSAGRYGVVFLYGFGECESEGSVVELLRDEFGLVVGAGCWFHVGQSAESVANSCDSFLFAFDLCE